MLLSSMCVQRLRPNAVSCNAALSACEKGFSWVWPPAVVLGMWLSGCCKHSVAVHAAGGVPA